MERQSANDYVVMKEDILKSCRTSEVVKRESEDIYIKKPPFEMLSVLRKVMLYMIGAFNLVCDVQ